MLCPFCSVSGCGVLFVAFISKLACGSPGGHLQKVVNDKTVRVLTSKMFRRSNRGEQARCQKKKKKEEVPQASACL